MYKIHKSGKNENKELTKVEVKMDTSNLKNIVVLKDLPSNLVEEAIVVLKENQKMQQMQLIDREEKTKTIQSISEGKNTNQSSKDYIIKEAQMLIAEYISKIENKNKKENQSIQKLKKKCKKLKTINSILVGCLAISIILCFVI